MRTSTAVAAVLALTGTAVHAETVVSVTQTTYDNNNRPTCTTVRMNPATYGALPASACTLATEHATYGPDRITKTTYDNAGQVTQVDQAYGTSVQRAYARYTYSNNGQKLTEKDANGNLTTLEYDGFDRLSKLRYPNTTIGAGTSSTTDYEQFGYDAKDNRTSWRRRNGITIAYGYDNLDRTILEDQPAITGVQTATEKDVHTIYDSLGRISSKRFASTSGNGVSYGYDSLGRISSTTDINGRSLGYSYNTASALTSLTYPDNYVFNRSLDNLNRLTQVYNGSTVFYSQAFTSRGLRKKLLRGAAIASGERTDAACVAQTNATCYSYDAFGRLTAMSHDLDLTGNDITWSFTARNPANQIISWDASSTNYDFDQTTTSTENKTYDGLNRDSGIAAISGGYDLNGNLGKESLTASDKRCMTYDVLNRLTAMAWCNAQTTPFLTLVYDTEGRLAAYSANASTTEFVYDGVNLVAEYTYSGAYNGNGGSEAMSQRYVHGTGVDEPLVWYAGSAVTSPNFLLANYQGSIIGYSNSSGALIELYRYDPYGRPTNSANAESWTGARFRYTGQYAIPEAKLYYYKARVYDPNYGRFLQTDPIGSKDDLNLYGYVGGDPINSTDPTGTEDLRSVYPEAYQREPTTNPNAAPGSTLIIGVHIGGSVGLLGTPAALGGGGSEGIAIDTEGNVAMVMSGNINGSSAGHSADAMIGVTVANGTVYDQAGRADTKSGQVGAVGVDVATGKNNEGKDVQSVTFRAGLGEGASVGAGKSQTAVFTKDNAKPANLKKGCSGPRFCPT